MCDPVYVCIQIEVQKEKGCLCNFEKYGPFSANWVRMGGSIKT
jgi:hypothetical protein